MCCILQNRVIPTTGKVVEDFNEKESFSIFEWVIQNSNFESETDRYERQENI